MARKNENTRLLDEPYVRSNQCGSMQRFCFGLGHIYNDLCAAIWFSYMLFYFQIVLQMQPATAGTLIMIGQVIDSLATPAAGMAMDRTGNRKIWHFAGTLAVAIGFSLLFSINPGPSHWWSLLYYIGLVVIFQIGWAVVQISHLSVIPLIARDHNQSVDLTAIRYTASVCCNIFVYLITWVILKNNENVEIGPNDFYKFKEIVLIVTCIGILSSVIFYCGIDCKEQEFSEITVLENGGTNQLQIKENGVKSSRHFLKSFVIYQVSLMYMSSRLFTTLSLIYIPLYLDEKEVVLNEGGSSIRGAVATVPLVCFTSSFLTSLVLKYGARVFSDKVVYLTGGVFSLVGCCWICQDITTYFYPQIDTIVAFIGIGGSATMVSSLCLTAEFVKSNGYRGASVYSTVTFTDKLISGGVVLIIQHLQCEPKELCPNFYRHVLAYACGSAAFLGLISLCSLHYYTKCKNARN